MKEKLCLLLVVIILLLGCQEKLEETPEEISEKECELNSDCKVSGCNGEICGKEEMMSICIYKPEFECYKLSKCKCIKGKCNWEQTEELLSCLEGGIK